jgi:hypothetical protein
LERNRKHFWEARGTPFTTFPLNVEINYSSSTHISELVLSGDYLPEGIGKLAALFLAHMNHKTLPNAFPADTPEAEILKKFAVWPEKTTPSPSGQHLGHYYSLLLTELPKDTKKEDMEVSCAAILTLHTDMINFALKQGKSFARWQKVVNIMLEKEPGIGYA